MERERIAREDEEKEHAERMKKIKDHFNDPNPQWEKDKNIIQNFALQAEKEKDTETSKAVPGEKRGESQDAGNKDKVVRDEPVSMVTTSTPTS